MPSGIYFWAVWKVPGWECLVIPLGEGSALPIYVALPATLTWMRAGYFEIGRTTWHLALWRRSGQRPSDSYQQEGEVADSNQGKGEGM